MTNNQSEDPSDFPFGNRHPGQEEPDETAGKNVRHESLFGAETPNPDDARAMLKRIDEMHEDLKRQIKFIDENIKYLPKEFQEYYNNPSLIDKEHESKIEEYEKFLEKRMAQFIGESVVTGIETRKKKTAQNKGNKAQRLRGRNKWISMD